MKTSGPWRSYVGLVRTWECDENEHLNLTFYVRAFQLASEAFAVSANGVNPGAETASVRHLRFHKELRAGAPFTIDTAILADGEHAGAVVHLMRTNGVLCATALDRPGYDPSGSSAYWGDGEAEVARALPRGLEAEPHSSTSEAVDGSSQLDAQLGIVRPTELDHSGQIMMHDIFSFCTLSSLHLLQEIGLSSEWKAASGHTHMGVEVKITRHGGCEAGDVLRSRSWAYVLGSKALSIRHVVLTSAGHAVASVQQVLVVVDSTARRAVSLPEFLRARR